MSFACIRDQEVAVRLLRNMLRHARISHALLFAGPSGVGKRLAAVEMAKAVNCSAAGDDACDKCLSCRKVASGNHPDLRVITPVKKSRVIDVDTIELVNEAASMKPLEGRRHVFLIHDAERMNFAAQNHFLKTLEEPPSQALFILTSEYPRLLLPTIRSRCQNVRFRSLRPETVVDLLKDQRDLPDEVAASIAAVAQGQMSRALDLVDTERRNVALAAAHELAHGENPVTTAEAFIKNLDIEKRRIEDSIDASRSDSRLVELDSETRERLKDERSAMADALVRREIFEYLYLLETWYRDVMVHAATGSMDRIMNRDRAEELQAAAEGADVHEIGGKLAAIEHARVYLERFIAEDRVFRDLFFTLAGKPAGSGA